MKKTDGNPNRQPTPSVIRSTPHGERKRRESQAQLRIKAEQALENTMLRLAVQSKALTALTATQACASIGFDERLRHILESCAQTLGVARASVWELSEDR